MLMFVYFNPVTAEIKQSVIVLKP